MRRSKPLRRLAMALLLFAAVFQIQELTAQSSGCPEGLILYVTGPLCGCPDGRSTWNDQFQCIGGEWEYQESFCADPYCPDYGGGGGCSGAVPDSCPYPANHVCPDYCSCCYV